jgi:hypothetical protein
VESIREKIMKNLQATFEGITIEAGYSLTVQSAQRFFSTGQETAKMPLIILMEGDDTAENDALKGASSLTRRSLDVYAGLILVQDPATDPRSGDEVMNAFRADVEQAVMKDRQRGGFAIDTKPPNWTAIELEDGKAPLNSVGHFVIDYRHLDNDPSQPV